jgi:hypothetical protein
MAAAAAELVAAAAAADAGTDEVIDMDAEEIAADVLDGLRRLDQGGNTVTWYVYCDSPLEREGFIEKLRTEQLDEQRFRSKYGPGEYRVQGRARDGGYVKGSHKIIKISSILADETRPNTAPDALSMLREMRAADDARATKRAEELKTYATILATPLATLGAALITRRPAIDVAALVTALRPQQSSLSEMTTALTNLKALQGDQGGGGGVEVVLKVLERLQDLPQGGGGELGWLGFIRDIIKEAAPHARELLGQLAQNRPPPQQQGALPPGATSGPPFGPGVNSAPALPQPQPPTPPTNGATPPPGPSPVSSPSGAAPSGEDAEAMALWQMAEPWLRRRAEELLEDASTNMDTELCAEVLLTKARKKFGAFVALPQLLPLLKHPQWWDQVTAFAPPLAPYQAWVDDVRASLVEMIEDELRGGPPEGSPAEPEA